MYLRVFLSFHAGLFVISRIVRDILVFLCWIFIFLHLKTINAWWFSRFLDGACNAFQWPNLAFHFILFLVQRVKVNDGWFVTDSRFIFFSFSLLQKKYMFVIFFFCILILIIIFLLLIFIIDSFRNVF